MLVNYKKSNLFYKMDEVRVRYGSDLWFVKFLQRTHIISLHD